MDAGGDHGTDRQICRAVSYAVAAVIVGLVTTATGPAIGVIPAALLFLVLFAAGLWVVPALVCPDRPVTVHPPLPSADSLPASPAPRAPVPAPPAPRIPAPVTVPPSERMPVPVAVPPEPAPRRAPAPEAPAAGAPAAPEPAAARHWSEDVARPAPAAPPAPGPAWRPTPVLPGQEALARERGSWVWRPEAPPAPAPEPAAARSRPAGLAAPRAGGPDDLKRIRGIGPKLEALLHSLGYYHFDQIAAWTAAEVAWVDEHLEGFRGRVTRDHWVDQAKVLAAGGETEFSARQRPDAGD